RLLRHNNNHHHNSSSGGKYSVNSAEGDSSNNNNNKWMGNSRMLGGPRQLSPAKVGVMATTTVEEFESDPKGEMKEYWLLNDELRDVQTMQAKWMKAARLRKIQRSADFALPTAETEWLMETADEQLGDYGRREL